MFVFFVPVPTNIYLKFLFNYGKVISLVLYLQKLVVVTLSKNNYDKKTKYNQDADKHLCYKKAGALKLHAYQFCNTI